MPAATPQSQAIALLNEGVTYAQQLYNLYKQIADFRNRYANANPSAIWAAFPTGALNADGSIGSADGQPNAAHPMTTTGINRTLSLNQAVALIQLGVLDLASFVDNTGSYSTQDRRGTLEQVIGG